MSYKNLIQIHDPKCEIYEFAISTEFKIYSHDELQSVKRDFEHCTRITLGAIYDKELNLIPLSERNGGQRGDLVCSGDPLKLPEIQRPIISKILPGKTLYLGYYMNHYGHFITETMARFWAVENGKNFDNYVFFPFTFDNGEIQTHEFHEILLKKSGVDLSKVHFLNNSVLFEELHIPQQLSIINVNANINLSKIFKQITREYLSENMPKRIFLSRIRPFWRVSNIEDVENLFRQLGFVILYPEKLNFEDQLRYYANCKIMAGFAGSSLHNCLFCKEDTFLIELGDARSLSAQLSMQMVVNQASGIQEIFIPYSGTLDGAFDIHQLKRDLLNISLLDFTGIIRNEVGRSLSFYLTAHYPWPASLIAHVAGYGDIESKGMLFVGEEIEPFNVIEGFSIQLDDLTPFSIEYKSLSSSAEWTPWLQAGEFTGSRGLSVPLLGLAVRLVGPQANRFDCVCIGGFLGQLNLIEVGNGEECVSPDQRPLASIRLLLRQLDTTKC